MKANLKIITAISFFRLTSFADVNLKSGGITDTISVLNSKSNLNLEITYRSRSYTQGLFGYGWCSRLDHRLQFISENLIQWNSCSEGRKLTLKKLSNNQWNLQIPRLKQTYTLTKFKDFYELQKNGIAEEKFNLQGRFLGGSNLRVSYSPINKISALYISGQKHSVRHDINQQVVTEIFNQQSSTRFFYDGLSLIRLKKSSEDLEFVYDKNLNRIEKLRNHQRIEKVVYDSATDRVEQYYDARKCLSKLSYREISSLRFKTSLTQKCLDQSQTTVLELSSEYAFHNGKKEVNRILLTKKVFGPGSIESVPVGPNPVAPNVTSRQATPTLGASNDFE